jgi:hypothetical protein
MRKISEKDLDYLEMHIPEMAAAATKQAYWRALASGSSVLIAEGSYIVEVFPDGTKENIQKNKPSISISGVKTIMLR